MDAVGIGSLNLDLIFEVDDPEIIGQLKPGTETCGDQMSFESIMEVLGSKGRMVKRSGGGSAANVMYAMSRMGMETGVLGIVGENGDGDFLLSTFEGVDVSRVRRAGSTGLCVSVISERDRSLHVIPNANDLFSVDEEDIEYVRGARLVHLTSFAGEAGLGGQLRVCESIDGGTIISLDPGELYASRGVDDLAGLLSRSDIVFPSDREVRMLTGLGVLEGARKLLRLGPETVVCTMGERGAIILHGDRLIRIRAVRADLVDKTGAGDVFAAAFLVGLLDGWDLEDCGRFAALASARSISGYGREAYPDRELVEEFKERSRHA